MNKFPIPRGLIVKSSLFRYEISYMGIDIQTFLQQQYNLRKSYHPSFSVRAFARLLEPDARSVVKVMKGNRQPKPETLNRWLKTLHVDEESRPLRRKKSSHFKDLDNNFFEDNYTWAHPLLLESLRLQNFTERKKSICHNLALSEEQFDQILQTMIGFGLVKKDVRTGRHHPVSLTTSSTPHTSETRKALQKKFLSLASEAIDKYSIEERDNGTLTVALCAEDLPKVKAILSKARQQIGKLSNRQKQKLDCVYNVTTAVYPVITKE